MKVLGTTKAGEPKQQIFLFRLCEGWRRISSSTAVPGSRLAVRINGCMDCITRMAVAKPGAHILKSRLAKPNPTYVGGSSPKHAVLS